MERERLKFTWGVDRWGDRFEYLPHNRDFWRTWRKRVPECECPGRTVVTLVGVKPTPAHRNGTGHKNGVFKLHKQPAMSAPIYSQLRSRLSVMLFRQTGDIGSSTRTWKGWP